MKGTYDFKTAQRGPVAPLKGKTRITIMLDDAVLHAARAEADQQGVGYQTLINALLREKFSIGQPVPGKTLLRYEQGDVKSTVSRRDMQDIKAQLDAMAQRMQAMLDSVLEVAEP